ncbi:MAG: hypothetical protein NVSMB29_10490 [Candidatus Dormibacteria bacterium]
MSAVVGPAASAGNPAPALSASLSGPGPGPVRWQDALGPYTAAKALALLVPVLAVWGNSRSPGLHDGAALRTAFSQWDAQSYLHIAERGYSPSLSGENLHYDAFLPGYPLLIALLAVVVRDPLVAGLLVSAAFGFLALLWCGRLVSAERGSEAGRFAMWLLALWPLGFFLSAAYTESAFLACAAIALVQARHGSRALACLAATAACSIRVPGLALLAPLAIEQVRRHGWRPDAGWWGILAVPLPFLAFGGFLLVRTGDALAYFHAESSPSYNRVLATPWTGFLTDLHQLGPGTPASLAYVWGMEVVFGLSGLGLCAALWAWPRVPRSYAAYSSAVWLLATSANIWLSVPRYELALLPGLIVLADLTRRRPVARTFLIGTSAGLMAFGTGLYASGRWLG